MPLKNEIFRGWEDGRQVKCLSCKHEGLSSNPQTPQESQVQQSTNPGTPTTGWEREKGESTEVCGLAWHTELWATQSPCLTQGRNQRHLSLSSAHQHAGGAVAHTHKRAHIPHTPNTRTHTRPHTLMQASHGQNEIFRDRADKIYVRPKYQTDGIAEIT